MYQHFRSSVRSLGKSLSKAFKKRRKSTRARVRRDFFAPEALESRVLMAGNQDLVAFAQALTAAGVKMYGADWCPICTDQKELFEDGAKFINFVEITNPDRTFNQRAEEARLNGNITMPTWVFADGTKLQGIQTLQDLADEADIEIPTTNLNPTVSPLDATGKPLAADGTITLKAGSPLWIPLDGFDPNGGPLTYQVFSSNAAIQAALAPATNKSARITIEGYGEMVFQLFNHLAPRPAERFEELANSGFYNTTSTNEHIVHRVVRNSPTDPFVIQMGDPTNDNGTGGSLLGDFDDQFSFDLQHNRTGILSYAKGADDTNDSQFFVTAADPRFLDFNHSIFGVQVEGDSARAGIQRTEVNGTTPTHEIIVSRVEIFNDTENGAMMLKTASLTATSGSSEITVRVTDAQGHIFEHKFTVNIIADTANGSPVFADPQPFNFTSGNPIKFTPLAVDAEGNTNFRYEVEVVSPAGGSATINSSTGEVTVTPPNASFAGQMQVLVRVGQTDQWTSATANEPADSQIFTLNVAPLAPTSVDLTAESDTGSSNSDNITRSSTLAFVVSGVTSGAQVRLFAGSQQLATVTASGTTATFTVDVNAVSLPLGPNVITAKQTVSGVESAASPALSITYDPVILDFTSPAPTTAEGNVPFFFDANNPEEGQAGFSYAIIGTAPTGLTFDTQSGEMEWTPQPSQVGTHSFSVRATDAAGNTKDLPISLNVSVVRLAQFSLRVTDLAGTPITAIQKGQEFFLEARVEDLRSDAAGVEAAFLDVLFNSQLATITDAIEHGDTFNTETSGTATAGSLDEVGGKTTATNLAGDPVRLFRIKLQATTVGGLDFTAGPASSHTSLIRQASSSGSDTTLDGDDVLFTHVSLEIEPNFSLPNQALFNVDEDSDDNELDVLAQATKGDGVVLTLESFGPRNHGGDVRIEGNKLIYTPADNFFGEETFTYTVSNQDGDTLTGTVKVQVAGQNDPPTAVNDVKTVVEDSDFTLINVLDNDTDPDGDDTLTIKSKSAGSAGGTIEIDPTNNVIRYKPKANFFGTETFTYVVQDGNGGEATGTVTVTVTDVNDPPTAVADTKQVSEDSVDQFIDVLANDSAAPDTGETLTVVAKTNGTNGAVKLEDGRILYTPNANFRGSDSFTYTIRDSRGGEATATVSVTVADSNDPPIANDDAVSVRRNTSIEIDVLANDSVGPDTGETLRVTAVGTSANGKATILPNGKISFEPNAGFVGTATFTYTISDPLNATDTGTVTVTVLDVAPSDLSGFVFQDLNDNGRRDANEPGIGGVTITLTGTDQDGTTVNKTVTTDLDGRYQFVDVDPGDYEITETQPAFLVDGRAFGGSLGSVKSSNAITVKIANEDSHGAGLNFSELGRQPQFMKLYELFGSTPRNSIMAAVRGSTTLWTQLGGTEWNTFQKVNVSLSSDRANVILDATNADGRKLRSTIPATDARVRFLGKEGTADLIKLFGGPSEFNLQVVANVAPSFTKGPDQTVLEDLSTTRVVDNWATNINKGAADESGQTLTFTVTADNAALFSEQPAITPEGRLSFKPAANANGSTTVRVTLRDNGGTADGGDDTSEVQTFTINITAVNDAPSFTKGPDQTVAEDAGAQTVNNWATAISAGPANEASQTLTFTVSNNNPNLFTVAPAIDVSGNLTYTPKANTTGQATITVSLKDNGGTANNGDDTSDSQTFAITVTGENDPPVAGADSATTIEETAVTINVLQNDSDPEGDTLDVGPITGLTAAVGTAVLNANNTITFTPAANFSGTATFTYELQDGEGGLTPGTVTVTVTNLNDAPVATDDAVTTAEDTSIDIAVLANDTDADGDTLTVTIGDEPGNGTTTIVGGVVTYDPDQEFTGTDTFTYLVSDGQGGTDTATVTITVTAVNDAPEILSPGPQFTDIDTPFVFTTADATNIDIDDVDVGANDLEVELGTSADEGTLTLGDTTGLNITTGDGQDDTLIIFRGTLAEITAALEGLTFTPASGFTGDATVEIDVSDLGSTGSGGEKTASESITITVEDLSGFSFANSFFDDTGFEEGVDDFMSTI